ncbi:hypothetical protein NPIL_454401 [Nephila pilipes]|uniref:Uncharacterized protein n=1 Tax=Nephila pilipes TaxID=299642 RepID=A0A8X6U455_NEPPI|nr:hypothetical protein NPIL_454401 [Nephila pilipes]
MESAPEHDMMDPKSPPESLPIEEIVQALEKAATHDGLRQIIYYIESDLSDTLANPHQNEETKERTINLSDLLIEARRRSLQFSQKEIERLQKKHESRCEPMGPRTRNGNSIHRCENKNQIQKTNRYPSGKKGTHG